MRRPASGKGGGRRTVRPFRSQGTFTWLRFVVLLLLLLLLGGFGFAAHVLWFILIAALVIWAIGFLVGGAADSAGGGRRGWYRW